MSQLGTTINISARVEQVGRTMALLRAEMKSPAVKGKKETIYATMEHHKVNIPIHPDHAHLKIPWDEEREVYLKRDRDMTSMGAAPQESLSKKEQLELEIAHMQMVKGAGEGEEEEGEEGKGKSKL
jgi:hypothetical protein